MPRRPYICYALTELSPRFREQAKAFYVQVGNTCAEIYGSEQRGFVPHEHYDPKTNANYTPAQVDAAGHQEHIPGNRNRTRTLLGGRDRGRDGAHFRCAHHPHLREGQAGSTPHQPPVSGESGSPRSHRVRRLRRCHPTAGGGPPPEHSRPLVVATVGQPPAMVVAAEVTTPPHSPGHQRPARRRHNEHSF